MDGHWGMLGHTSSAWSSRGSSMVSDPLIYHVLKQGWCSETEANWSEKKNLPRKLPSTWYQNSASKNKVLQQHETKQNASMPPRGMQATTTTAKQNTKAKQDKKKLFISRNCRIQQSCRCPERETQQLPWIKISFTNKMKSSWKLTHRHGNL